jgi:hypothetical protein
MCPAREETARAGHICMFGILQINFNPQRLTDKFLHVEE